MKTFSWAIASLASLTLVACGSNTVDTTGTTGGAGTTTGSAPDPSYYPVPGQNDVVGLGVSDIFPNISLHGGAILNFSTTATADCDARSGGATATCPNSGDCCTPSAPNYTGTFSFHDLFQAGKPAPDGQGFRYAFIDISGAWCPHCQDEANDLPGKVADAYSKGYVKKWLAQGGIVFSILVQDNTPPETCTPDTFFTWINHYQLNYPISIDDQQNMVTATSLKAWPGNVIIRLSDMKVMQSVLGADSTFYDIFTNQLTQCQGDGSPTDCYTGSTCQSGTCVANANP